MLTTPTCTSRRSAIRVLDSPPGATSTILTRTTTATGTVYVRARSSNTARSAADNSIKYGERRVTAASAGCAHDYGGSALPPR